MLPTPAQMLTLALAVSPIAAPAQSTPEMNTPQVGQASQVGKAPQVGQTEQIAPPAARQLAVQTSPQTPPSPVMPAALPNTPPSAGPVLFTLSGDFDHDGHQDSANFTLADIKALGEDRITTTTIWTEGPQTFTGVWLRKILDALAITKGELTVTALNDYSISIPVNEITTNGALLAYARNGAPMSVRDKGPLWLVYPYDSSSAFRNEVIFSRSVWQLDQMSLTDPAK